MTADLKQALKSAARRAKRIERENVPPEPEVIPTTPAMEARAARIVRNRIAACVGPAVDAVNWIKKHGVAAFAALRLPPDPALVALEERERAKALEPALPTPTSAAQMPLATALETKPEFAKRPGPEDDAAKYAPPPVPRKKDVAWVSADDGADKVRKFYGAK